MATLDKQHNFIWYGVCGSDETSPKSGKGTNANGNCLDYTLVNTENIQEVHLISGDTNQTWKKNSNENDFTSLICGNAYYVKLEVGLDNVVQDLIIPHAIHSAQNYKIAECEVSVDDSPLVINNLWIAFATSDSSTTKHSDFYEVQGLEAETVRVDFNNAAIYNQLLLPTACDDNPCPEPIDLDGGGTFLIDPPHPFSQFPYLGSLPSGVTYEQLDNTLIQKDEVGLYVEVVREFDYTKFKIIEDGFATAIQAEIDAGKLFNTSHVMLVKSTTKPVYGEDGYDQAIATAFNFPGEMVLKCGDTWNYEDDAENQTYIEFDCSGTKFKLLPRGTEDPTLDDQRIDDDQDEKEWHGASNTFFRTGNMMSTQEDNNPSLIDEFYFVKSNGNKVKFGDGNPKGSHCE